MALGLIVLAMYNLVTVASLHGYYPSLLAKAPEAWGIEIKEESTFFDDAEKIKKGLLLYIESNSRHEMVIVAYGSAIGMILTALGGLGIWRESKLTKLTKPEPVDADNPRNPPRNSKNQLDD